MSRSERFFRIIGFLEAWSYLILLLVAMPLKYIWGRPEFVFWTGSFHGLFFVLYCFAILAMMVFCGWRLRLSSLAFLAAFFPFGPFIFERRYLDGPRRDAGPAA